MRTRLTHLSFLAAISMVISTPTFAGLIYDGGTGAISFGVAPYGGAPNVGGPTYIADNVTGRNDILTSPGLGTLGGYLTASPVVANNIASFGGALPLAGSQNGGGNGSGSFGSGTATNAGSNVSFSLADSGPGGGSASYLISAANFTFTDVGADTPAGTSYGAYLAIAGLVPLVGNVDVASLRVHLSDTAGVFGAGGTDLPQLVLAISRNGAGAGIGNYDIVTIGGVAGGNAALILDDGVTGAFRALAVDNQTLAAPIPVGDILSISVALTGFTDPASFSSFDPTGSTDLLSLAGALPQDTLMGTSTTTPEPGTWALFGTGLVAIMLVRRRLGSRKEKTLL
ncbi:MAG TPA: PEP-CTERM sorting domain-containing protein [Bryobacteraceae bacterium]|jgi:hypothetical protein